MVANRGEIAIRIFRACTELGRETIAVFAEEDSLALHRYKADEAYLIGRGKGPIGAYLDIEGIIALARAKEIDAIHPGYGFLAENADFAAACQDAGITFIGPDPQHLEVFGDKVAARRLAVAAGIPVIPGTAEPISDSKAARAFGRAHGYPVLIKAVAGGGGRGQRVVHSAAELDEALQRAQSEAGAAFGSAAVFVEKYIERPRHIEVQVLADRHGQVVHLFERDCSVQRRHQKVVEIAPSLALGTAQREEICQAAVRLAGRIGYVGAGTVEFLLAPDGRFYFLEVNPRLQVEHTVTEVITGIDIVQAQIHIAEGTPLSDAAIGITNQAAVAARGYAIQCRITTEDAANGFVPDTGRIVAYRSAGGFGLRLDGGSGHAGAVITPHYDSLLVKVTSWGLTFPAAAAKMVRALQEFRIRGVKTNIPFLQKVVQHPTFLAGNAHTRFVDETPELYEFKPPQDRGNKLLQFLGGITVNGGPGVGRGTKKPVLREPRLPEIPLDAPPPTGTRQILDQSGPAGLSRWVAAQQRVLITDTTLRDAHQSLLATRLRTHDMVAATRATAHLLPGLFSLEMWGGATFDTAMRFLKECPWQRLDRLRAAAPGLLLQMLLRGANAVGYANYPDNVIHAFIRESAAAGIDVFRIFDSLNWVEGMRVAIDAALQTDKVVEGAFCYTGDITDPRRNKYNLDYYVKTAKELEQTGIHILGIKDMAGLLKPQAAGLLIGRLKEAVGIPIHLHTHDTSGNGAATVLAAVAAGVDIVDLAMAPMSGLTSQPSLGGVAAALQGTPRDPGLDLAALQKLSDYWEDTRAFYFPFESGLKSSTADIYVHEMPGGQYSNLRVQAEALGLGDRWDEVKQAYATVNRLLGDIIKVTPSSKAVGDFALFLVQNDLDAETVFTRGEHLTFPDSVIALLSGMMGRPPGGFPQRLQRVVLKERRPLADRPGALLDPVDLDQTAAELAQRLEQEVSRRDVLSHLMYPGVFAELVAHRQAFSDTSPIDTPTFFYGLRPGEETTVEIEPGKTLIVRLTAVGELLPDGTRYLYFELNGQPREIRVRDESAQVTVRQRPKADANQPGHVGATMPGKVVQVLVEVGDVVRKGHTLVVTEAMKMETSLTAPLSGRVQEILVAAGDTVDGGDLLLILEPMPG